MSKQFHAEGLVIDFLSHDSILVQNIKFFVESETPVKHRIEICNNLVVSLGQTAWLRIRMYQYFDRLKLVNNVRCQTSKALLSHFLLINSCSSSSFISRLLLHINNWCACLHQSLNQLHKLISSYQTTMTFNLGILCLLFKKWDCRHAVYAEEWGYFTGCSL